MASPPLLMTAEMSRSELTFNERVAPSRSRLPLMVAVCGGEAAELTVKSPFNVSVPVPAVRCNRRLRRVVRTGAVESDAGHGLVEVVQIPERRAGRIADGDRGARGQYVVVDRMAQARLS